MRRTVAVIAIACISLSSCTKRSIEDAMGGLTLENGPRSKHLRATDYEKRIPPVSDGHAAFDDSTLAGTLPNDVLRMIDDHMADFYIDVEPIETTASYFPKLTLTPAGNRGHAFVFRGKTNQRVFPPMNKEGGTSRRRMMSLFTVGGPQFVFRIPAVPQLLLKTNGEACTNLGFYAISSDLTMKMKINDRDEFNIVHLKNHVVSLSFDFNAVNRQMAEGTIIALYNPPKCELTVKRAYRRLPHFGNMDVTSFIQEAEARNLQVRLQLFTDALSLE